MSTDTKERSGLSSSTRLLIGFAVVAVIVLALVIFMPELTDARPFQRLKYLK